MNIAELIRIGKADRSYEQLARDCGGQPTAARLQQIATKPVRTFPDPPTIRGLSKGLRVTEATVVLAAAESLGLDVRRSASRLVSLLPAGVDRLTDEQVDAVLSVVHSMTRSAGEQSPAPVVQLHRRPAATVEAELRVARENLEDWDQQKLTSKGAVSHRKTLQARVDALEAELIASRQVTDAADSVAES